MTNLSVCAISGSLRAASFNTAALRAAVELAPEGLSLSQASIADIPLYDDDLRAAGIPPAVTRLQAAIASADAVLIATPEYNYSVPGALKNAIDWVSRTDPQPFADKPVAIMGASPSALGTGRAQYDLRKMFVYLDAHLLNKPEVMISAAHTRFDADGKLTDETTRSSSPACWRRCEIGPAVCRGAPEMGQLIDGVWHGAEEAAPTRDGGFVRPPTVFRDTIERGGRFAPAPGRYHLYASLACPWAHRTLIFRRLKKLEPLIGLSITHWLMAEQGWTFAPGDAVVPDPFGAHALHEIYTRADPHHTGRVSVPVLWDTQENTIVNNESADIIRLFNSAFDGVGAAPGDYYPAERRAEIDEWNDMIYGRVNNGVYRAGFAKTQAAHDAAITELFETLGYLEARLSAKPFLTGHQITEADWRLFTTLIRFDAAYHGHFKCNLHRVSDYPALQAYMETLYRFPGVSDTVNFYHIKRHYYLSHPWLDPTGIVPVGPESAFLNQASGRV